MKIVKQAKKILKAYRAVTISRLAYGREPASRFWNKNSHDCIETPLLIRANCNGTLFVIPLILLMINLAYNYEFAKHF